jgi:uncharacterized membrane protein
MVDMVFITVQITATAILLQVGVVLGVRAMEQKELIRKIPYHQEERVVPLTEEKEAMELLVTETATLDPIMVVVVVVFTVLVMMEVLVQAEK